jgi:uncharacterized membrane protein YbhN (UPF0104 family)
MASLVLRARTAAAFFRAHPLLTKGFQLALVVLTLGFCAWAVRDQWSKAEPLLAHASPAYLALAFATVAAYYLVFIFGWIWILAAWGIRIPYRVALGAEMVSLLAKYIPGAVWTPAARAVALRRSAGVRETPTVIVSVFVEAALSAISGVIVFVISLAWVDGVNAPLLPLIAFAVVLVVGLHPRIFRPVANKFLRPFTEDELEPLPFPVTVTLLSFYCITWLVGGLAVYFMLRSLGAHPGPETLPYLGGVSAVGAIVAVVAVFAPSGLGAREASMYGLLLAVTSSGPALGATLLNRLLITIVELVLFGVGVATWRLTRRAA